MNAGGHFSVVYSVTVSGHGTVQMEQFLIEEPCNYLELIYFVTFLVLYLL